MKNLSSGKGPTGNLHFIAYKDALIYAGGAGLGTLKLLPRTPLTILSGR